MPIYEYKCETCGHQFEKLMRISADAPPCPECDGDVRKLVSAAGFILKGSGWYKDHYGLKGSSSSGANGSASTPSAAGSDASSKGSTPPPTTAPAPKAASGGDSSGTA